LRARQGRNNPYRFPMPLGAFAAQFGVDPGTV
jgi:hypothetical protein